MAEPSAALYPIHLGSAESILSNVERVQPALSEQHGALSMFALQSCKKRSTFIHGTHMVR